MSNYFWVYYAKDPHKKKKIYSQGVLVCQRKRTRLFSSQGEQVYCCAQQSDVQIGEDYILHYKYAVNVERVVTEDEFLSGKIFIPQVIKFKPLCKEYKRSLRIEQMHEFDNGLRMQKWLYVKLRQHQIEGVQFMFGSMQTGGCILADFMGLGKTLQTLALCYSMIRMGLIDSCIVVCPLSVAGVWEKQTEKWLDGKIIPLTCVGVAAECGHIVQQFSANKYRLLIISYEWFSRSISQLKRCDLLVLDEGHRLKNKNTKLCVKLSTYHAKRRIMLTGTPIQNNLQELYTCVGVISPRVLPPFNAYKSIFITPIVKSMHVTATSQQKQLGRIRSKQLTKILKLFCLRRKIDVLKQYLPEKKQFIVGVKLTPAQKVLYQKILSQKIKQSQVLSFLNVIRKLFTHPRLLKNSNYNCNFNQQQQILSYKFQFVLSLCRTCIETKKKLIIVSYYTQSLDLIGSELKDRNIIYSQLDGRSEGKKRHTILKQFNDYSPILLLSGKAGGTGLTLTCAEVMVLLEPDWNPSNDSQVMGRLWRQGQTRPVYIYRLLVVSSFEERIIQRQRIKNNLSEQLIDQNQNSNAYDFLNISNLFISSGQKCVYFAQANNIVQSCKQQYRDIQWKGVVHVQMISSNSIVIQAKNQFAIQEIIKEDNQQILEYQEDSQQQKEISLKKQQSSIYKKQTQQKQQQILNTTQQIMKAKQQQMLKTQQQIVNTKQQSRQNYQSFKQWTETQKKQLTQAKDQTKQQQYNDEQQEKKQKDEQIKEGMLQQHSLIESRSGKTTILVPLKSVQMILNKMKKNALN